MLAAIVNWLVLCEYPCLAGRIVGTGFTSLAAEPPREGLSLVVTCSQSSRGSATKIKITAVTCYSRYFSTRYRHYLRGRLNIVPRDCGPKSQRTVKELWLYDIEFLSSLRVSSFS